MITGWRCSLKRVGTDKGLHRQQENSSRPCNFKLALLDERNHHRHSALCQLPRSSGPWDRHRDAGILTKPTSATFRSVNEKIGQVMAAVKKRGKTEGLSYRDMKNGLPSLWSFAPRCPILSLSPWYPSSRGGPPREVQECAGSEWPPPAGMYPHSICWSCSCSLTLGSSLLGA